ncbi:DUF3889 domain-containing protein [Niallia sp. FSL W8-0635]|uniref:DUF3889 domain-containing protein n=1 Tax=Niallia sp. FSL W8-0635 TaxID=2975337 RepID=UPI0009C8CF39|nr:Uncharacterised protein [Mycobacteroides abscessus subsp. abscessus]HEO8419173.1 DUF3889 domain-containing protein [Yersinia enterocolitica]
MKILKFPFIKILLVGLFLMQINIPIQAEAEGLPSYVKWGRIAMTKAQEKYPNSEVTDYLHVGKEDKKGTSVEKFKLIVKKDQKEIGVFVNLTFDTRTERLLSVDMEETQP